MESENRRTGTPRKCFLLWPPWIGQYGNRGKRLREQEGRSGGVPAYTVGMEMRVGISGWTYPPWRGNFYPEGLPQKLELAYASRRFNAHGNQRNVLFLAAADEFPGVA